MTSELFSKRIIDILAIWRKSLFFIFLQLLADSLKDLPRDKEETSQERARILPERAEPNKEGKPQVDIWSEWAEEELRDRSRANNGGAIELDIAHSP